MSKQYVFVYAGFSDIHIAIVINNTFNPKDIVIEGLMSLDDVDFDDVLGCDETWQDKLKDIPDDLENIKEIFFELGKLINFMEIE